MPDILPEQTARRLLLLLGIGALIGLGWALARPFREPAEVFPPPPEEEPAVFADSFIHFFPGRTHDGSRPRGGSVLLRATKFLAGERVGLRVQTAPDVKQRLTVELRFLTGDTREETPALRNYRQSFRIRPGLRTYCCLRIPKEPGEYSIGLLLGDEFLTFFPAAVKKARTAPSAGLFARPQPEETPAP